MIKNETIDLLTVIRHVYCDECGIELKRGMQYAVAQCEICGKDLCDDCIGHEVYTMGDYREVYCKSCWDIGEPYRNEIHQLENKIESLYNKWHKGCEKKSE